MAPVLPRGRLRAVRRAGAAPRPRRRPHQADGRGRRGPRRPLADVAGLRAAGRGRRPAAGARSQRRAGGGRGPLPGPPGRVRRAVPRGTWTRRWPSSSAASRELGLVGWKTHSNFGDSYLDERRYWPILAKAEELDVPVYLHPAAPVIPQLRTYGLALAGAGFGFGVETALAMMRLVLSGAFDAFPRLKVILGHYGEGLPFSLQRVDHPFVRPAHQGRRRRRARSAAPAELLPAAQHVGLHERQLPAGGVRLHPRRAGHGQDRAGHGPSLRGDEGGHGLPRRARPGGGGRRPALREATRPHWGCRHE